MIPQTAEERETGGFTSCWAVAFKAKQNRLRIQVPGLNADSNRRLKQKNNWEWMSQQPGPDPCIITDLQKKQQVQEKSIRRFFKPAGKAIMAENTHTHTEANDKAAAL